MLCGLLGCGEGREEGPLWITPCYHCVMSTAVEGVIGVPEMREAKMHLASPAKPGVGRVVASERCTASTKSAGFVRHVSIDVSNTPLAGNFVSGQSFGVIPPGTDANGKPHKLRLYSIASPTRGEDGQGNVLATTVKRTIDEHHESHKLFLGVCSNYLCDLQVGEEVLVTGPNGKRFVLPVDPSAHDYLFIATGTGIAPFRGMTMDVLNSVAGSSKVMLAMGAPYASDLLYHQDLFGLAGTHANFTYVTALSREYGAGNEKPAYVHQRLAQMRDPLEVMLRSPRTLVYVCGIAGMEIGVLQTIASILPRDAAEQYLRVSGDGPGFGDVSAWTRAMLQRHIQPTRRVFLEVY
jgi:ferredoxin--NADP+ reductase